MKTVELSVLTAGAVGLTILIMSIVAPATMTLAERASPRPACTETAWSAQTIGCAATKLTASH